MNRMRGGTIFLLLSLVGLWSLLAACGTREVGVEPTSAPLPTATHTPSPLPPFSDACQEYLHLAISTGEVREEAVATAYACRGLSVDSTGQSPAQVATFTVRQGGTLRLEPGATQPPTAIEVRLYPGAGLAASFMRWPEELPVAIQPVERGELEMADPITYASQAAPGTYSLVVRIGWASEIAVFYAASLAIEAGAAPTPTSTTALPTASPTVSTPSVARPNIASFEVMPGEADPGDAVTLQWEAQGDRATLCPASRYVLFDEADCREVPPSGSTTFTIPEDVRGNPFIDWILRVESKGVPEPAVWQVTVAIQCDRTWFFSDEPQAGICPRESVETFAAIQRFERGTMIWLRALGRYVILVETPDVEEGMQGRVTYLSDPLDIIEETSSSIQAPEGLYAPQSGFGLAWRGDVQGVPGLREDLGWALAPEYGYEARWQCDDARPSGGRSWQTCYLEGPEGEVYMLDPLGRWYVLEQDGSG